MHQTDAKTGKTKRLIAFTRERFWFVVGIIVLAVDILIAYSGGSTTTVAHGLGFAAVALAFAFLPDAAYEEIEKGRVVSGVVLAILTLPIGIQAYQNHITYTGGVRVGDMQQTRVVNDRFADARKTIADNEAKQTMLANQLDALERANVWAGTVTAEGMRAQIDSHNKAIELETARGGCKVKCLALMQEKAKLEERIAIAEARADLTKQISATKVAIETARKESETKEFASSMVANTANINAQLLNLITGKGVDASINPNVSQVAMATLGAAGLNSLALMLLAPMAFFLDGRRRPKREKAESDPVHHTVVAGAGGGSMMVIPAPQAPSQTFRIEDGRDIGDFLRGLNAALVAPAGKAA